MMGDQEIDRALRYGMRCGLWIGFIGGSFFWLWALYGVIVMRDEWADMWHWLRGF